MALTGLPSDTDADIARVTEALAMITPRWTVRILLALAGQPLRYSEIASKVPWLHNGQLHPKLRQLCEAGLVERIEHSSRHVTYGPTDRATELLPVLPLIVTWAERYLEKPQRPLSAMEQVEDSLTLLTRRHAAAILWVLKSRDEASAHFLAKMVMPGSDWTNIYPPLRQLVGDGLVDTAGKGQPYRLSSAGEGLGPVLGALSAWSAGQSLAQAAQHPVWGRPQTGPTRMWVSNQTRLPAPATVPAPSGTGYAARLTWQHGDLFSHAIPPRPLAALSAGGPRR
ncbi:winged helix-turn-helix transcriptional regulator [Streptomyces diastatochromogenes]|uniref:MarR family transcriptional regulator n=1 Tax=Streptomyces diastatochromogenes TaxID=42236 RepID=A0A233SCS4_STRDA|nr:helix-turn-helix domain-containing protein [Streptomyces diastatochromogenes]MCZ0990362.1 helix-turn-helix domain-containing protein [Streptomyces diastatochromogenes]OXY93455.1 MarR family transcriptional regulator [Streptomyces diastatochromogenes]